MVWAPRERPLHLGERLLRFGRELADRRVGAAPASSAGRGRSRRTGSCSPSGRSRRSAAASRSACRARSACVTVPSFSVAVRAGPGDEVERDVELAGEQVAGAQLRAQAAGRRAAAGRRRRRRPASASVCSSAARTGPRRSGIDLGEDLDREALARWRRTASATMRHAADLDAEQVDRRAFGQAAHRRSNTIRTGTGRPSGGAIAAARSVNRVKTAFSGAGAGARPGGFSNARPPASTEASVCVLRLRPLALSVRSMPLAFQKRVSWRHQLLVRRLDEDLHRQLVALGVERVADDPADAACGDRTPASRRRASRGRRSAARRSCPARRAARTAAPRGP